MLDDDDIKDTELSQGADDAEADFTPEAFEPEEKHEDKTVTVQPALLMESIGQQPQDLMT